MDGRSTVRIRGKDRRLVHLEVDEIQRIVEDQTCCKVDEEESPRFFVHAIYIMVHCYCQYAIHTLCLQIGEISLTFSDNTTYCLISYLQVIFLLFQI